MKKTRSDNYLGKRIESFGYAIRGLKYFFRSETHAKIHLLIAVLALAISYFLRLSNTEWLWIILSISLVMITEIFNTCIEKIMDFIHPEIHKKIKIIKDMSAGAVLMAAIFAVIIGGIIFLPKIISLI